MTLRKKSGIGCAAALLIVSLSMGDQIINAEPFSHCQQRTALITELPISHAKNRCAHQALSPKISWSSWFSGKSIQFHYLDLLELLSRREASEETYS